MICLLPRDSFFAAPTLSFARDGVGDDCSSGEEGQGDGGEGKCVVCGCCMSVICWCCIFEVRDGECRRLASFASFSVHVPVPSAWLKGNLRGGPPTPPDGGVIHPTLPSSVDCR